MRITLLDVSPSVRGYVKSLTHVLEEVDDEWELVVTSSIEKYVEEEVKVHKLTESVQDENKLRGFLKSQLPMVSAKSCILPGRRVILYLSENANYCDVLHYITQIYLVTKYRWVVLGEFAYSLTTNVAVPEVAREVLSLGEVYLTDILLNFVNMYISVACYYYSNKLSRHGYNCLLADLGKSKRTLEKVENALASTGVGVDRLERKLKFAQIESITLLLLYVMSFVVVNVLKVIVGEERNRAIESMLRLLDSVSSSYDLHRYVCMLHERIVEPLLLTTFLAYDVPPPDISIYFEHEDVIDMDATRIVIAYY